MYPVLTKTASKRIFLHTGKSVCSHLLRFSTDSSDEINLPPEPTTCCMTGCANCVWIEYAETVAKLLDGNGEKAREMVLNKIQDQNLKMFLAIELKNIQYNLDQSKISNELKSDNDKGKL